MKRGMKWVVILVILLLIGVTGTLYFNSKNNSNTSKSGEVCTAETCKVSPPSNNQTISLANPASVYCEEHNGTSKIITAPDGSQSGICVLWNGTECDEWNFFKGEC